MTREEDNVRNSYCAIKATPRPYENEDIAMAFQLGLMFGYADKAIEESKEEQLKMDINKIHDAMKVLKDECKKYKKCEDCIFFDNQNEHSHCYLEKEPASWKEDEIVENNCTAAHLEDIDEWYCPVLRCDNCDGDFMLGGFNEEHIVGKFCPHCGKKIVNYKEDKE